MGKRLEGGLLSNGNRVSVWDNETFLDVDSGDGCTTWGMYLTPLNCTLKVTKMVNFMLSIFYHNKKAQMYKKQKKNKTILIISK